MDPGPPKVQPAGSGVRTLVHDPDAQTLSLRGKGSIPEGVDPRYELGELIARGGQGDIFRAYDRRLRRQLVMKVLDKSLATDSISIARFIQEAQVTAQLEHPSIVPVHDIGALSDGRPYYTMTEVRGRTLATVIDAVHAASYAGWAVEPGGFGLGRLVDVFQRVCEAVGYAHSCRIVHRDLKPQNMMVGTFGEALVLDWGLARLLDDPTGEPPALSTIRDDNASLESEVGTIVGTKGYMAPEQAQGDAAVTPASDVYSLGMILREILTGERIAGATLPQRIPMAPVRPLPAELVAIVERAIAPAPGQRYTDARELAQAVGEFLDGDRKREKAMKLLAEARALLPRIAELRDEAAEAERAARAILGAQPPFADSALKEPGWELEDRARDRTERAERVTFEMTRLVDSSLIETELAEAHALLAAHYRERHEQAERTGDASAAGLELLLRTHDRGEHAAYLTGRGAITLHTDVPATIELRRYEQRGRRLVHEHVAQVEAPLVAYELPRGSYLLIIRAPGRHEVRYPVAIARNEHWVPIRPGDTGVTPVVLPLAGSILPDEVYVAGGPFWCGGDPQAAGEVMPRQRVWVDSFALRRHPITNAEVLAMANGLLAQGDAAAEALALGVVPRHRGASVEEAGTPVWPRGPDGQFSLGADDEGVTWRAHSPTFMVNWHGALAYAEWLSRSTGLRYRLPGELEHEKAARGGDGRAFPWGGFFDPTWAVMRLSHAAGLHPADVDQFPVDESPYGARHLAGNVVEWCADEYRREGPPLPGGLYLPPVVASSDPPAERTLRGGCFLFDSFLLRAATRHNSGSVLRDITLGFRLARSLP